MSILFLMLGVAWGIIGGAIPGISPSIAIVLALPFTYHMEASVAISAQSTPAHVTGHPSRRF